MHFRSWRRLSAAILAVILMISFLPVAEESQAAELNLSESRDLGDVNNGNIETISVALEEGSVKSLFPLNNDELFEDYMEVQLKLDSAPSESNSRGSRLTGTNQAVYNKLKGEIGKVANGDQASTVFEIAVKDFGLEQDKWTAKELGVNAIVVDNAISPAAQDALLAKLDFDLDKVVLALLYDCPYELYWYDKVKGASSSGAEITAEYDGSEWSIFFSSGMELSFSVAQGYAAGQYAVDTGNGERVSNAVNNAQSVVEKYASVTDYEKLLGYKNEICYLVTYDQAAADDENTPYGDPWQIISVFDEDEDTNVVCEGYAKSFQYLCDMTEFKKDISCISVTGTMSGGTGEGAHMWDIVNMDDGNNYLVDVTNCDAGTIGADSLLFIVAASSGNVRDGYAIELPDDIISYVYDSMLWDVYSEKEIILSLTPYTVPEDPDNPFVDIEEGKYYYEPVLWAYNHEPQVTKGTDPTHFSPEVTCTRAQVVTFLWRAEGCPEPTGTNNPFVDNASEKYYYKAVLWAAENGITTGTDKTHFSPDKTCTRAQVVTFLWRAMGQPAPENISNPFSDNKADHYFYNAVLWAVENGVTKGTSPTKFSPDDKCTRGQVVTFLYRAEG